MQCLDGPVNCFSLTFCIILIQVLLLLTVTLRGVSNKHFLLPLFHYISAGSSMLSSQAESAADKQELPVPEPSPRLATVCYSCHAN